MKLKKYGQDIIVILVLSLLIALVIKFNFYGSAQLNNFASTIDYVGSNGLLLTIIGAFAIVFANIFPNSMCNRCVRWIISKIPEKSNTFKKMKNFLYGLIHINKKVIIFLPKINDENREAVFLQVIGFNNYLKEDNGSIKLHLSKRNNIEQKYTYDVEMIFITADTDDISDYFDNYMEENFEYIVLTGMSEVFKDAVNSRSNLTDEKKKANIKIVGALSSISSGIEDKVNDEENIIRVFPPDYDESKIAMDFLMSRVKSNICHSTIGCDYKDKNSNIIVIHAQEYGKAIVKQCKKYFEDEMYTIDDSTNSNLDADTLKEIISLNSYSYSSIEDTLTNDDVRSSSFEVTMQKWKEDCSTNYFFIVGYEPNISNILYKIQPSIDGQLEDYCFLFSSPTSLDVWGNNIDNALSSESKERDNYYIYSKKTDNEDVKVNLNNDFINYKIKEYGDKNIIDDTKNISAIFNTADNSHYNNFNKNNFVSHFAKLGISVVRRHIESGDNLLKCKKDIFDKYNIKDYKLLINGDTINNFKIQAFKPKSKGQL